ncbi:MAG: GDP-mannose 4,6-dehydratase, partial [Acidobacteriota bacterium]
VLDTLRAAVDVEIAVEADPDRMRKADLRVLLGDAGRARTELGWSPRYTFDDTLATVLDFWRQQAAKES